MRVGKIIFIATFPLWVIPFFVGTVIYFFFTMLREGIYGLSDVYDEIAEAINDLKTAKKRC